MADLNRRSFMGLFAAALAPASSMPLAQITKTLETGALQHALSGLSPDKVISVIFDHGALEDALQTDGKEWRFAGGFAEIISDIGLKHVRGLRAIDALGVTPKSIFENSEDVIPKLLDMVKEHFDSIDPEKSYVTERDIEYFYKQIKHGVKKLDTVGERSYDELASQVENSVKGYIKRVLSSTGGKEAIKDSFGKMSRSDLKALEEQYGDVLPDDIKNELKESYSSWHLEKVGGSGHYFKIVVSDDISLEERENVTRQAEEKLGNRYQMFGGDEIQYTSVGKKERWLHVENDVLAREILNECEEKSEWLSI